MSENQIDKKKIESLLPHREPMLLIDKLINIVPLKNTLHQNYPNPFNPSTSIPFDIIKNDNIRLSIYNVKGELIRTLINSNLNPGSYEVRWNGRSDSGVISSAGMYFVELKGTNFRQTSKMLSLIHI